LKLCGPFDEFEFVIYTNAEFERNCTVKLDDMDPARILSSGRNPGGCITFDEERDNDIFRLFQDLSQCHDLISEQNPLMYGAEKKEADMLSRTEILQESVSSEQISKILQNLKSLSIKSGIETFRKELQKCNFSLCKKFLQKVKIFQCQSDMKHLENLI
jgi:hypothetical protein